MKPGAEPQEPQPKPDPLGIGRPRRSHATRRGVRETPLSRFGIHVKDYQLFTSPLKASLDTYEVDYRFVVEFPGLNLSVVSRDGGGSAPRASRRRSDTV
jgi:hypothetical protein